jgi:dihydroneopterin aldolase
MKHGQIVVWAPSKLVLDATHPPPASDARALAEWLAGELKAAEFRVVDTIPVAPA